jgi:hypothetical protein
MKRIMGILAVVALVAMTAQAVEVTSENVAGVYTKTLPAGGKFIAISVAVDPFDPADATLAGVLGTDQLRPDTGAKGTTPDQVYIWDGMGYGIYKLKDLGSGIEWTDGVVATNPPVPTGEAFWIKSAPAQVSPLDIVITGQAVESSQVDVPIVPGFHNISYGFSSKIAVNDTTLISSGAAVSTGTKGEKPDTLYLWDNVNGGYTICKVVQGNGYWEVIGGDGSPVDVTLEIGDGFWYKSATNSFTWAETNKYIGNL